MANTIKLKRGSGSDPGTSDLSVGEVAVRTDEGKLFTKKDDGSIAEISGGGGIDDGDKGDITVSSSGATWTIDADAVTYAKIQNVSATDRLLGRDSSGAGVIEEITPANVRTMLGLAASATTDTTNASNIGSGTLAAGRVATLNQDTTGSAATLTTARNIGGVSFNGSANIDLPGVNSAGNQNTSGNAATATILATARTIGGVSFNGSANINLPGVNTAGDQNTTGNAATATALATARTIAGVSFDGSANISLNNNAITNGAGYLTSVGTSNISDDAVTYGKIQNVSATNRILGRDSSGAGVIEEITPANVRTMLGLATSATTDTTNASNISSGTLAAARVATLNQNTTGTAALATNVTVTANNGNNENVFIAFVDSSAGGTQGIETDSGFSYNPSTNTLTTTTFVGEFTGNVSGSSGSCTGNAATATVLATARNIGGVSFNGSANINLPGVNAVGNQNTTGSAATLTTARTIGGVSFNGSANINLPGVNATGNQNTSGSSASCTGNAATATVLATARTIAGVSFNGSANISLNNNAITNGAGYVTSSIINSLNASNLSSGTVGTARLGSGTANSSSYLRGDGSWATISAGAEDGVFWENDQAVTSNYTITNNKNAMSAGPITINSGVTVTIGSGEYWTIV